MERWAGGGANTDLSEYRSRLGAVERRAEGLDQRSDESLRQACRGNLDPAEALALGREAASRSLGMRPFDEQLIAAMALSDGHLVEMQTGEGKTLAAVFAAWLQARSGHGVHVLTFNDYLARRDAEWMRPLYEYLGVSVASVQEETTPERRREAYRADVTYLTAKQAGFDFLRDSRVYDPQEVVQRPFHAAILDEADSLLIDEARVPLVLAGSVEAGAEPAHRLVELIGRLDPDRDYRIDENDRNVDLTEAGLSRAEGILGVPDLLADDQIELLSRLHCALHAQALLSRDRDYIVQDGQILLVDELTGRVAENRHWPDGLQAALEAKEGLSIRPRGEVLGSITLQHLFRHYGSLAGMTGTAKSSAREFKDQYGLQVRVIPTHRPSIRVDEEDLVFADGSARQQAVVEEIARVHASGRPVLVGTATVAESERLALALADVDVPCEVLNARNDEREAEIIAAAGRFKAVTISTNMAGRGTDIRLGDERVVGLGGLYVIGTHRHESERIDRQLRGRAGRQGDPGSSRLFLSLDDDLHQRFGICDRSELARSPRKIRREVLRAQRIADGQNAEIRRTLTRYAETVEEQRKILSERRRRALHGKGSETERLVTLFHIDRAWSDHLRFVADLREGIHLLRIGGQDPLTEFVHRSIDHFAEITERIDLRVRESLAEGDAMDPAELRGPSSTWTYLVSDDPFRDQLGVQLAGNTGVAAAAALYAGPLLILTAWLKKRSRRGSGPGARPS